MTTFLTNQTPTLPIIWRRALGFIEVKLCAAESINLVLQILLFSSYVNLVLNSMTLLL